MAEFDITQHIHRAHGDGWKFGYRNGLHAALSVIERSGNLHSAYSEILELLSGAELPGIEPITLQEATA